MATTNISEGWLGEGNGFQIRLPGQPAQAGNAISGKDAGEGNPTFDSLTISNKSKNEHATQRERTWNSAIK